MKLGIFALMAALLMFVAVPLTASAGPIGCVGAGTDTDGDGTDDNCDNCDAIFNAGQEDCDLDGYGDACDCDFDQNNFCDGSDFLAFGSTFSTVPTGLPPCTDMAQPPNNFIDGSDFLAFGAGFGAAPGTSCGNPLGIPCP